jgi:hypothetical protein
MEIIEMENIDALGHFSVYTEFSDILLDIV